MAMSAHPAVVLALGSLLAFAGLQPARAADAQPAGATNERTVIKMPPDMRAEFLDHMSHHMAALNDVITAVASGNFQHAAQVARDKLEVGAGKGFGRYLPIKFREMGLAMHRAAGEFATAAEAASVPPSAENWKVVSGKLGEISARCQACHATFRVE